jgi:uncharacterized membrane protein
MTPAAVVACLWVLFGGSHIGLAAVRGRLVARLGEVGFIALFYSVAATSFAALVSYYAQHRFDGVPGFALAGVPALRWVLMSVAMLGLTLAGSALIIYPRLPSALFGQPVHPPRGIERITRHPFFAGIALFAVAHGLLATHLIGTVFFGGVVLLTAIGARHQDHKLRARRGPAYADYLAVTSAFPFAAIAAGRQTFAWRELPAASLAIALGLALAARHWHDSLFAGGGWWIIAAVLGGALIAGANAWRRSRRVADDGALPLVAQRTNRR